MLILNFVTGWFKFDYLCIRMEKYYVIANRHINRWKLVESVKQSHSHLHQDLQEIASKCKLVDMPRSFMSRNDMNWSKNGKKFNIR